MIYMREEERKSAREKERERKRHTPVTAVRLEKERGKDDENADEGGCGHGVLVHQGRQDHGQNLGTRCVQVKLCN